MRIITDSAADYTHVQARELNIEIVPLSVSFDAVSYDAQNDEDFSDFYRLLSHAHHLPISSQPSPAAFLEKFTDIKSKQEEAVVITISSGLSGTFQSAQLALSMVEYDSIHIVDSKQAIMAQRLLVDYAVKLRSLGKSALEICKQIEQLRERTLVFGALDTLKYLRKGGRIPGPLAVIGEAIKIKPLIIQKDTKLQMLGKARGQKSAYRLMLNEIKKYVIDPGWAVYFGYTANLDKGIEFMKYVMDEVKIQSSKIFPIGPTVGTHVGANGVAVAFVKKEG